jgi:2-polyprenyl-3-methyl-5-hydroxy-6-metoxy-1,4-benzoquinol methylase
MGEISFFKETALTDKSANDYSTKEAFLTDRYFPVCRNKSVVEIGPFEGWFTDLLLEADPTKVTLIEANPQSIKILNEKFTQDNVKVIHGDMHYDLDRVGQVQVAVVLGVIYHTPSPLMLLESIVNRCNPDTIIIDNHGNMLGITEEVSNEPGMRFTVKDKRTCGLVVTINSDILIKAMYNLGYSLYKQDNYPNILVPIYQFNKRA